MAEVRSAKPKTNILIVGKIGTGKSSIGNTLAREKHFDEGGDTMSETVSVTKHSVLGVEGSTFVIFDTQGLRNPKEAGYKGLNMYMETMERAVNECDKVGLHVFLLAFNVNCRVTPEDSRCINLLETIFGNNEFWSRCIIVLTRADIFEGEFDDWLEEQTSVFKDLREKCQNRIKLLTNKKVDETKYEDYRKDLIKTIVQVKSDTAKSYTIEDYKKHESNRYSYLLSFELRKCNLGKDFETKISEIQLKAQGVKSDEEKKKFWMK